MRPTDKFLVAVLHGLQHGINSQTERTVVLEIFLLPRKGDLATHGKERDISVGGIHLTLYLSYRHCLIFDFLYTIALVQQDSSHAANNCNRNEVTK